VSGQDDLTPAERYAVLERDGFRCRMCGNEPGSARLVVGHILSVADLREQGADATLFRDPANLLCLCDGCNAGQGRRSLPLHLAVALLTAGKDGAA
jgi:hypothetical protein